MLKKALPVITRPFNHLPLPVGRRFATIPSAAAQRAPFFSQSTARAVKITAAITLTLGTSVVLFVPYKPAKKAVKDLGLVPITPILDLSSKQSDQKSVGETIIFASSLLFRVISLGFLFLPALIAFPVFLYLNSKYYTRLISADKFNSTSSSSVRGLWFISLLTWSLQAGGPAFIKLAQYASSREDLFSFEVCQILGRLQDRGAPHSMMWTRRAFRVEDVVVLSGNDVHVNPDAKSLQLADLFDEFNEIPVGVGAIAQVYKAKLRQSQKIVAVKILHPSVVSIINKDLIILKFVTETLTYLFPNTLQWLSLPDEVAVFSTMMRSQTDLRTEANNLLQFRSHFQDWSVSKSDGGGAVLFPQPILTSPSILVEEFIDAIPISRFLSIPHTIASSESNSTATESTNTHFNNDDLVVLPIQESARLRSSPPTSGTPYDIQLAKIGMRSFVKMLLVDNFCHADLHPGNITVCFVPTRTIPTQSSSTNNTSPINSTHLPPGIKTLADLDKLNDKEFLATMTEFEKQGFEPRLVYLDAGLVSTLSDKNLVNLNDLLVKIVSFDGVGVAKLLVERQRGGGRELEHHHQRHQNGNFTTRETTASVLTDRVVDFDGFSEKMSGLLNRIRDSSLKLSTVSFSWILRQVFGMVRTHHVRLEGDFANVGVAVMLVEGVGRQLDPGVDLLEEVRGVVIREWVLAVGDLWVVRAILEVYTYSKQIGMEVVRGKWSISAK
ncbi:UNVERIFIED_CONTAM: hypothetical protein HDU68_001991 [Siphonaria sp. JEL0065]|nr:hypothetical protein HDU68_001991 [Siphonaria sp. JEL0065]